MLAEGAAGEGLDVFCANDKYGEAGLGLEDVPGQAALRNQSALPLLACMKACPFLLGQVWLITVDSPHDFKMDKTPCFFSWALLARPSKASPMTRKAALTVASPLQSHL